MTNPRRMMMASFNPPVDNIGHLYFTGDGVGSLTSSIRGDGSSTDVSTPVQIGTALWVKLTAAHGAIHGVQSDGKLYSWGDNSQGNAGVGSTTNLSLPTQVGAATNWNTGDRNIATGQRRFAAIDGAGKLYTCGGAAYGGLGNGTTTPNVSSLTQIGALTNWKHVSGHSDGFTAIKTDGTIWTWGWNGSGRLGLGDTTDRSSPTQIGALTTWSKLGTNNGNTWAIKTDGTLWTWGQNASGECLTGNTTSQSSPIQIGAATDWVEVGNVGGGFGAINSSGQLYVAGANGNGNLGLGDTTDRSSLVQVGSDTDWSKIFGETDAQTSRILKTDNTLWGAGNNDSSGGGTLGDGTTVDKSSPVQCGSSNRVFDAASAIASAWLLIDDG